MTDTQGIQKWLSDWFQGQAPDVQIELNSNYFELGAIDSFGAIELVEDIEEHFAIRFSEQDFQDRRFATLAGLSEIIVDKTKD